MMKQAVFRLHRTLILVVLAVALVATGFAHRPPSTTDTALEAVLLAGGSLADLCGDSGPGGTAKSASCLACQITASAQLPAVQTLLIDAELAFVARVIAPRESRALSRVLDSANTPQGPPVA